MIQEINKNHHKIRSIDTILAVEFEKEKISKESLKEVFEQFDRQWLIRQNLQFENFEASFEKHDNSSFETVLTYAQDKKKKELKQAVKIDCYFFFPENLALDKKGYKGKEFLQNLTNYIRLKSPQYLPSVFLDTQHEDSPLAKLCRLHETLLCDLQDDYSLEVLEQAKLASSYILHFHKSITPKIYKGDIAIVESRFLMDLDFSRKALQLFRKILDDYTSTFYNRFQTLSVKLNQIDEYLSFYIEKRWIPVLKHAQDSEMPVLSERIKKFLTDEHLYRKRFSTSFGNLDQASEKEKEAILYRIGKLKKFIQRQLYLPVRYKATNNYVIQGVAMFAALLAASFAYAVEIYHRFNYGLDWRYNAGLLLLISSITYALKDRIKDLVKQIIINKFTGNFDNKREIFAPGKEKQGAMANISEKITLKKRTDIDPELIRRRYAHSNTLLDGIRNESIIHYEKIITIDWGKVKQDLSPGLNELKEIYRFNLRDFCSMLDDPNRGLMTFFPETGEIKDVQLSKVYHFNVFFQITPLKKNNQFNKEDVKTHALRIIVDRNGIKRIENRA